MPCYRHMDTGGVAPGYDGQYQEPQRHRERHNHGLLVCGATSSQHIRELPTTMRYRLFCFHDDDGGNG